MDSFHAQRRIISSCAHLSMKNAPNAKVSLPLQNDAKAAARASHLKTEVIHTGECVKLLFDALLAGSEIWGKTATTGVVRILRVLRTKSLFGQMKRVVPENLSCMQEKKQYPQ